MIERGGGGHARAPGKPPPIRSSVDDIAELGDRMAVIPNFREVPVIAENTYFGTKSKDPHFGIRRWRSRAFRL